MNQNTAKPVKVLIVDDQRDLLMTAGILLRSEGFEVRLAEKGSEAAEAAHEFKPDVILLDIDMPDKNGLQVALELKKRFGAACPVLVALTGHKSEAARRLTKRTGFRHHVTKPYDFDALVRLVTSLGREAAAPT